MIPALHEADRIHRAIESALAPGVEILVVDGGSRDATRDRAREAGARVIESESGRARQLAAGAAASGASVLLFLHADSVLPSGYRLALERALEDPGVVAGAFAFRFDRAGASPLARLSLRAIEWGVALRNALFALPYGDQGIFVRRPELDAIGGVPQLPILEDVELVRRLKQRGRLALLQAPVVTSARRYLVRGPLRTVVRNAVILAGDGLGVPRDRLAAWYRR